MDKLIYPLWRGFIGRIFELLNVLSVFSRQKNLTVRFCRTIAY